MPVATRRLPLQALTILTLLLLFAYAAYFVYQEMQTSRLQAHYFSEFAAKLKFSVQPGASASIRYPHHGPYDFRLGYVSLPEFIQRLRGEGFSVTEQARMASAMVKLTDSGLYSIYHEKNLAGLRIFDGNNRLLSATIHPEQSYANFDAIPPLVVKTLLFIENRKLLDERHPQLNPAVEWERFGKAALDVLIKSLGANINAAGGSTLATQLEKFRHSPGGITTSLLEKLRQMFCASLRSYLDGPYTLPARRNIVLSYLNSVPLAATDGFGEVQGVGEALRIWYHADFVQANRLLAPAALNTNAAITPEQGKAYRQMLCLLLSQRRPSYYLGSGHEQLQKLADSHLRLLASAGIINTNLRDSALKATLELYRNGAAAKSGNFIENKTRTMVRSKLAGSLGVTRLYDLDRIDLTAKTSLNQDAQQAIATVLASLRLPENARAAGLFGERLLRGNENLDNIVYSLTLYERSSIGNLLRIQTDNYAQPLDINEGIRLDLGSTAKLRTMVLYLQLIDELYRRYYGQARATLQALTLHPRDHLSAWVVEQLLHDPALTLPQMLDAALEKRYSGSPEWFFTGGGLHSFANFNKADNRRIFTVKAALRESINLVFIRLMRDIVYHYLYRPDGVSDHFERGGGALRIAYLQQFIDQESKTYLKRFYGKYHGKSNEDMLALLTKSVYPNAARLTTVYRSVYPEHELPALKAYLQTYYKSGQLSDDDIDSLFRKYGVDKFNLHDRGYIARIHPLELWLVNYLRQFPAATFADIYAASSEAREEVYGWLFKTRNVNKQNRRIQTLLEKEAFAYIHDAWRRLGYPFGDMTASYATAIGASGDRPAALAQFVGILLNNGVNYPTSKFQNLHFAAGTPFETRLQMLPSAGQRVLAPEVAAAARSAAQGVVAGGTASRLRDVYRDRAGKALTVGGKTGTGDHVRKHFGRGGRLISTEVISRTATFIFFLGERHFGAITAYVTGPDAAKYRFTSALPVQVLKSLRPVIQPLLLHAPPEIAAATPNRMPVPGP